MIYPLIRSIHKFDLQPCPRYRLRCSIHRLFWSGSQNCPCPGRGCQDRSWWGANGAAFRSCSKNGRRYLRYELPKDAKTWIAKRCKNPFRLARVYGQSPEAILPQDAEQILRINVNPELTIPPRPVESRWGYHLTVAPYQGLVVNPLINKPGFSMV